ncbi:MAG: o-succinylbenzoate synthase [Dehalococcoidia bacterium]
MGGQVTRIAWRPFSVPFVVPLATATGSWAIRDGFIVELETADGFIGVGEASPLPGVPLSEVRNALADYASAALSLDIEEVWNRATTATACPTAAFGVELAVASAAAARRGWPLHRFLGSVRTRAIPVNGLIDATGIDAAVEKARSLMGQGHHTVKMKVGGAADADIARIRAVRDVIGPAIALRIDANGGWDEGTAAEVLAAAARSGVSLCEQPVPPGSEAPDAFARLTSAGVPLAADESCRSVIAMRPFVDKEAISAVVVKPMLTGLREGAAMLELARDSGIEAIVTTTFDVGVGVLGAMHLAATLPDPLPACGLATLNLLTHPLVTGAPSVSGGFVDLPGGGGIGVSLDRVALDRFATGPWTEVRA